MADYEKQDRVVRDAAGVGPYARDVGGLVALSELDDWRVAEGEPDIRGWEVRTVSGRDLGKVKDLLIDEEAGEVVMLDVDLSGSDQHVLVPIRIVQVDRLARIVRMDSADLQSAVDRASEATDVPVPVALTPAEVDRRADVVGPTTDPTLADRAEREDELRAEREAGEKKYARYPRADEVVVEQRPVVVEEKVVRRRNVHGERRA